MGIVELIEIGLAHVDEDRGEVTLLEPAELVIEAVGGLAAVVARLAESAVALASTGDMVRVSGRFDQEDYRISVSGIASDGSTVLNRMWEDPELAVGLAAAARMAARQGFGVEFLAGVGARLTVPSRLVTRVESDERRVGSPLQAVPEESPVDFVPHELDTRVVSHGHDRTWSDSEAFLEELFAPLMREVEESGPAATVSSLAERESGNVAVLEMRVPGENYSLGDDDSPSTAAAEGAVDLRSALSTFDEGRRSAELADREVG